MKKRLWFILCGFYFVLMFSYAAVGTYLDSTSDNHTIAVMRNLGLSQREGRVFVGYVSDDGSAPALRVGDEVLAVNGHPLAQTNLPQKPKLERLNKITVARNGRQETLALYKPANYLAGAQLHPIAAASSVRVRNGKELVTDGCP